MVDVEWGMKRLDQVYHSEDHLKMALAAELSQIYDEDRLELIPVADDPLAAVRAAASELRDASVEQIGEDIEDEVKTEARSESGK